MDTVLSPGGGTNMAGGTDGTGDRKLGEIILLILPQIKPEIVRHVFEKEVRKIHEKKYPYTQFDFSGYLDNRFGTLCGRCAGQSGNELYRL
jgi:hypothetical protein